MAYELILIDPCAVGEPRFGIILITWCPLNKFSFDVIDSETIVYAFLAKNLEKKTNVFLTCHVTARSPGPGRLIFLPFQTQRIKKSHRKSNNIFFTNSLISFLANIRWLLVTFKHESRAPWSRSLEHCQTRFPAVLTM